MPTDPTSTPATCQPVGRSRSSAAASSTETSACACNTSEASPAGIPASMAVKSTPNFSTPSTSP